MVWQKLQKYILERRRTQGGFGAEPGSEAGQKLAADGEASADAITTAMKELIEKEPLARIDYVKAVDAVSREPVSKMQPPYWCYGSLYGKIQVIDNFIYEG